ncbi:NAD(P)-dependent dehydrogenase (short-subunit alcohol dehydrogenase family) [Clostridium beijerinckii]|uniref:Short chain dehydrogenase n=1 Tax=Clostridium beijerinckii TaxID=1520 RepID=A0A1S8SBB9_CLOBE|nr:SDR family oxidoreductase [Clostridium beijerinckii]NRY59604.1 NAD(P)-dependent dehydrogenase (short-subunit alcohol dehydrogenase family) [Clostridium beijerinckii]OOM62727.1 short chain dehydrogenase [Clostridium beijerinckii]
MKFIENNGRIINFSTSVVGSMFPTYSVYAATKGAVEQITRQLANAIEFLVSDKAQWITGQPLRINDGYI